MTLTTFRHLPFNAPFYTGMGFREIDASDWGAELRKLLEDEIEQGLDPAKRVAMRLAF